MLLLGIAQQPEPPLLALLCLLCGRARDMDVAMQVWQDVAALGLKPDLILYSALIDTCAKVGGVSLGMGWMGQGQSAVRALIRSVEFRVGDMGGGRGCLAGFPLLWLLMAFLCGSWWVAGEERETLGGTNARLLGCPVASCT